MTFKEASRWGFGALSLTFVACGTHVDYLPLNAPPHELHARQAADVEVFSGAEPTRRYVEVGTIDARSYSHGRKADLIPKIREVAARHGCEAIKMMGRLEERGGYRAACLVYEDAPVVVAPPSLAPASSPPVSDAGAE